MMTETLYLKTIYLSLVSGTAVIMSKSECINCKLKQKGGEEQLSFEV